MEVALKVPTFVLVIAWFAVLAPLVGYGLGTSDPYYTNNWGSTYRIATEFTAGALTYLIVQRLSGANAYHPAAWLSAILPALVVAGRCSSRGFRRPNRRRTPSTRTAEPLPPYFHLALVPLLVAWIGALALARSGVARALSTRTLVLGGSSPTPST